MCRYLHVQTKYVVEMDEDSSCQQASAEVMPVSSCENDSLATKSEDNLHVNAKDEVNKDKMVSGLQSFQVAISFNDNFGTTATHDRLRVRKSAPSSSMMTDDSKYFS